MQLHTDIIFVWIRSLTMHKAFDKQHRFYEKRGVVNLRGAWLEMGELALLAVLCPALQAGMSKRRVICGESDRFHLGIRMFSGYKYLSTTTWGSSMRSLDSLHSRTNALDLRS